jgi:hypothetical protein
MSSIISAAVTESNAHVGSSARIRSGLFIKALAIETLCCSPQDNSDGFEFSLCDNHTSCKYFFAISSLFS